MLQQSEQMQETRVGFWNHRISGIFWHHAHGLLRKMFFIVCEHAHNEKKTATVATAAQRRQGLQKWQVHRYGQWQ